jgi:protein SCO1/2
MKSSLAIAAALALASPAGAEPALPQELEDISIVERPGSPLPREVVLTNQDGVQKTVGDYLDGEKPLLLVLAYYRCPMLCGLVIHAATDGMKGLLWDAGKQYRLLVVSIDPRDTPRLARDKRDAALADYGREVPAGAFDFAVSDAASVKRLADAVGFRYRWDEATQQFAHAAGAFAVTPQGVLSRTLLGISFPPDVLKLALVEASEGQQGGAWDKVVLFCFHYDPAARGYVLAATRLMRVGGAVSLLLLGAFLWTLRRQGAARDSKPAAGTPAPALPNPMKSEGRA